MSRDDLLAQTESQIAARGAGRNNIAFNSCQIGRVQLICNLLFLYILLIFRTLGTLWHHVRSATYTCSDVLQAG